MTWYLETLLACALYGLLAGQAVPAVIARVPEPTPAAPEAAGDDEPHHDEADGPPVPVKERYADIAARRGLRWKAALATATVAGLLGGAVGWSPALYALLFLVPIGVALAVIDWRTRLLPTKLIAPTYVAVVALVLLAGWSEGDLDPVIRAAWGWLFAFAVFFVLWFVYPRGMGYGDVRLSGVLGIVLGYLGVGRARRRALRGLRHRRRRRSAAVPAAHGRPQGLPLRPVHAAGCGGRRAAGPRVRCLVLAELGPRAA